MRIFWGAGRPTRELSVIDERATAVLPSASFAVWLLLFFEETDARR